MVRRGEDRNIFPFQEEADLMFNSSLVYEMSVLKAYVEPLLLDIGEEDPAYTKARQLLRFTSNFMYLLPDYVPFTSILREFIGGSGFRY
jgi:uridine kinase